MTGAALRLQRISKRYRIGVLRHNTIRDSVAAGFQTLVRRNHDERAAAGTLWALRDVSCEIQPGEVVGIIGRNGAGKSTLLKILSRITAPTTGRVEMIGRVGSLLEVGTGFHPELSGRENIYLNGAILGMGRREINRKFDEIVAFAGIEKFLETPVKRYSSGMYVRLGFAVAAHLEPEILIVDEVLAVGDAEFQRKCLGKMNDVASEGRTVLFVSHNMGVIRTLCQRGIYLRDGGVEVDAGVNEAVSAYLMALEQSSEQDLSQRTERGGRGDVRLRRIEISMGGETTSPVLATGRPARFALHVSAVKTGLSCAFNVFDHYGQMVCSFNSRVAAPGDRREAVLGSVFVCEVDELLLAPGRYLVNADVVRNGEVEDHVEGAAFFDVEPGEVRGRRSWDSRYGSVIMPHRWRSPG